MWSARRRPAALTPSPRKNLPPNAEEGSCIIVYDDGHIEVDIEKTLRRRAANMYKLKNLLCKRKEK